MSGAFSSAFGSAFDIGDETPPDDTPAPPQSSRIGLGVGFIGL